MDVWDDDEDDAAISGGGCYACGGRGWMVVCIDDMCHGQDECMHGDDPVPCRTCNPNGENFAGFF